jgi:MFS family permease
MALPPDSRLRRDLRSMTGDAIAFSLMVGVGESFFAAFVLATGHGEVASGLVTTLPVLMGALLQLVTPTAVRRLRSFRRWVVACAIAQAASFTPLVSGALSGEIGLGWIFAAAAAYWGFGMGTGPAWNTWATTLVPRPLRARYFAQRGRWSHVALLTGVMLGGILLHRHKPAPPALFAVLFVLAALARLVSAGFLARQSEPERPDREMQRLRLRPIAARLRGTPQAHLLGHILAMHLSVNVAAPFFTPYMLGPLDLSYGVFAGFTAAAFLARIFALPALGRLGHKVGPTRVMWLGAVGVVPLPALWLVSDSLPYLLTLQLVSGTVWAAFELAVLLSFFESLETRERTSVLTLFNLASAIAVVGGSLLGGALFSVFEGSRASYVAVFVVSSLARAVSLLLLRGVPSAWVPEVPVALRPLAMRPSAGVVARPVVASVPDKPGTP